VDQRRVRPVIRRVLVTTLCGGLSFPLTNLLFDAQPQQLAMSAAVGAIALVVQLLVDIDQRLATVETGQDEKAAAVSNVVADGFRKVSTATDVFSRIETTGLDTAAFTDLAAKVADIGPEAPPLVVAFAQSEINRVKDLLGALANGESTREGEDHDNLLDLTRLARRSIDATSLFAVDAGGLSNDGGFWNTDLGQSYLDLQHRATMRGVQVRRIFIMDNEALLTGPEFQNLCRIQADCGIDVRILVPSHLGRRRTFRDYVLFDETIGYEVVPCIPVGEGEPWIQSTILSSRRHQVGNLIHDYSRLWEWAVPPPRLVIGQVPSEFDGAPRQDSPSLGW
jgi:hypothetical protein